MRNRFLRQTAFLLSLIIIVGLCLVDAGAQSRRRRRSRRVTKKVVKPVVTNPAIAAPGEEQSASDSERIISTADGAETEPTAETATPKKSASKPASSSEMQQTINKLSNQVDRLNDKLTQMQQTDRTFIDMERLTRAEVRAESLRSQQVEIESKLADAQSKLELIEYQLRPENIEHASGYGTVHPEEAREARRKQLENEKSRVQAQIKILETSRVRLETALVTADAEVDSLRRKIEQQPAPPDTSGVTPTEPPPAKPPE